MSPHFTLMNASDVIRDGLGVELVDENGQALAEVFRCDADNSVLVNTFDNDIPLDALEQLLQYAKRYLEPFEDGTPLSMATNFGGLPND